MFGNRAQFTWGIDDRDSERPVLYLADQGSEGRSLTNDIENCLTEVAAQLGDSLLKYRIMYRDSEGEWDGLEVTQMGSDQDLKVAFDWLIHHRQKGTPHWTKFLKINFHPIREKDYHTAWEKLVNDEKYHHHIKPEEIPATQDLIRDSIDQNLMN